MQAAGSGTGGTPPPQTRGAGTGRFLGPSERREGQADAQPVHRAVDR